MTEIKNALEIIILSGLIGGLIGSALVQAILKIDEAIKRKNKK